MKNCLALVSLSLLLFSCKEEKKPDSLSFSNDFENIIGWAPSHTIDGHRAHSGKFCSAVSEKNPYGQTFSIQMKQLKKPIKKAKVSFWASLPDLNADAKVVVEIKNQNGEKVYWEGLSIKGKAKKIDEWTEISETFSISGPNVNHGENTILVYLWNVGASPIYHDDLVVEFE